MRKLTRYRIKKNRKAYQGSVTDMIKKALDSQFAKMEIAPQPVDMAENSAQIEYTYKDVLLVKAVKVVKGKKLEVMVLTPEVNCE